MHESTKFEILQSRSTFVFTKIPSKSGEKRKEKWVEGGELKGEVGGGGELVDGGRGDDSDLDRRTRQ